MEEILEVKEAVVAYLDRSGGLKRLIEDCRKFEDSQQSEAVYRFCITVNPTDVIETDARLGDLILHRPVKATALFQSTSFLVIKTLSLIAKVHTESQVNVVLRLLNLPPLPGYGLDLSKFPRRYGPMRPIITEGLVTAITRVTKYTQGARFVCSEDSCPCSTGFHHIRVHAPGATESATVRCSFTCMRCAAPLKEDMKFRVLGDKQLVEMMHTKALENLSVHPTRSSRYQSVTVFLRDELCNSMEIGKVYRVIGIPAHVHQWPHRVTWSIEANDVQPLIPKYPSSISDNFQALLMATASSPWRFSAIVANTFGACVVPPGVYNTLKLALLLSLVQTGKGDSDSLCHLDVLALTNDPLISDRLMAYSLSLACRGVRHQATKEMLASLSEDHHGAGTANIHAGAALLATGGICLLGDLACYRKDKLDVVQSALETRTATVFIPGKKYGEDADQVLSFPIQCNFWALGDAFTTKMPNRGESIVLASVDTSSHLGQAVEAFDLVIQCHSDTSLLPLTVHTLRQAVTPGEPLYPACMQFTTQDYHQLVAVARGRSVERSPEAERLIHGYYLASRRVRVATSQGLSMSVASLKHLMSLAEAHCKLSLRSRVLEEDAVIAVLLCEASLTLKHGPSALVIPSEAVFPCELYNKDSLNARDQILQQLQQQILLFIHNFAPAAANYTCEE